MITVAEIGEYTGMSAMGVQYYINNRNDFPSPVGTVLRHRVRARVYDREEVIKYLEKRPLVRKTPVTQKIVECDNMLMPTAYKHNKKDFNKAAVNFLTRRI